MMRRGRLVARAARGLPSKRRLKPDQRIARQLAAACGRRPDPRTRADRRAHAKAKIDAGIGSTEDFCILGEGLDGGGGGGGGRGGGGGGGGDPFGTPPSPV